MVGDSISVIKVSSLEQILFYLIKHVHLIWEYCSQQIDK
jgi:hypothetical protein